MSTQPVARDFYCPHCGAGPFPTRDQMRKHIYDVHMKKG